MSHPHDRALIAFATTVLGILEDTEEWSADTLEEIYHAADALGLSTSNDDGHFREIQRADFKNPTNL